MPLVKGPVNEVMVEAAGVLDAAYAAVASGTACAGKLLLLGRDEAACRSVLGRVNQVRQHLIKLQADADAIDESKSTAPSEATRVVKLVGLYVDELRYHIRESRIPLKISLEPDFEWLGHVVEAVVKQLAKLAVAVGEGAGRVVASTAKGLADGLGPFGLLLLGAAIYYGTKGGLR